MSMAPQWVRGANLFAGERFSGGMFFETKLSCCASRLFNLQSETKADAGEPRA